MVAITVVGGMPSRVSAVAMTMTLSSLELGVASGAEVEGRVTLVNREAGVQSTNMEQA